MFREERFMSPKKTAVPKPGPALRLHEVLREEHRYIPPAPPARWWEQAAGSAPTAAELPPAGGDSPNAAARGPDRPGADTPGAGGFALVDGDALAGKITALLRKSVTRDAVPAAAPAPAATARPSEEHHYERLAEWVREHRSSSAAAAEADPPADGGAVAVLPAVAAESTAEVSASEIESVLAKKLAEDLPHTEAWLQNADLRPFTRGLLKRHLQRAPSSMMRMLGRGCDADPELNRLLLEDAFAKHVERRDDRLMGNIFLDMRESARAALCLSGGGIRSATFALGVVQGLARNGVLGQFRYLSTVSGGGYLGSWLSAWSRHEGMDKVIEKLDGDRSAMPAVEAAPVRHLRQYSNYLSPRLGVLSADSWTLGATFLRNLLLIWLVLVPLLAAVVALPWLVASLTAFRPSAKTGVNPSLLVGGMAVLAAALACRAIAFIHAYRPETDAVRRDDGVPALRRDQAAFLRMCLVPLAVAAFLWAIAWRWFSDLPITAGGQLWELRKSFEFKGGDTHPVWSAGTLMMMGGGAAVHLVGWLFALRVRSHTRKGLRFLGELVAIVVTGLAAGFLVVLTSNLLGSVLPGRGLENAVYATFAVPGYLTAVLLAGFAYEGLNSRYTDDAEREWTARYSAWLLVVSAVWLVVAGVVLFGPHLVQTELQRQIAAGVGVGSGALTAWLGRSPKTGKDSEKAAAAKPGKKRDWGGILSRMTLPLAAVAGVVALGVGLSFLDMVIMRWACSWDWVKECKPATFNLTLVDTLKAVPITIVAGMLVALAVLGWVLGRWVETNRFSLHAMYRARLIRAYLGASRPAGERRPDPFTGFDEADNIHMGALQHCAPPQADGGARPPFHVLNVALNLVAGRNLAWQERKATSFTVSPLHAGANTLGYRPTWVPGAKCPTPEPDDRYYGGKKGITLGTAMTISGAAASPNMGYHSSPAVTFLMTLFNARLGWWLGNPGPAGDATFHDSSPRSALRPLLDEMLGATDDTNEYVYLSDGGHFENLGVYEMVLRRNRFILVSDASCDEECSLQDLGNAIRKIRIDLGIPIEFYEDFPLRARSADPTAPPGRYWAFARIRYACVDTPHAANDPEACAVDGVLLYLKPGIYGGEPRDVFNYAAANPAFPHESTADQFFSESQFESYRALGSHALQQMVDTVGHKVLKGLFTKEGQTAFLEAGGKPVSEQEQAQAQPPAPVPGGGRKIKIDGILQDA
jgi:hypothetical protein